MTMNSHKRPFFSIVMPVYNGEKYLTQAIASVLRQTERDWELVIVDDCSSDRSREIIESFSLIGHSINYIFNEQNLNIAASLNRGIDEAMGEWIVRLDCDDLFSEDYLNMLRGFIEAENGNLWCFFSSWISVIDEEGKKVIDVKLPDAKTIARMMKFENFLYHPATSFSKKAWQFVGGYPVRDRTVAEDTAMWLKFIEHQIKLVIIPYHLIHYRIHGSNITSRNDARLFRLQGNERDLKAGRQYREWRISLFLKQSLRTRARRELLSLWKMQRRVTFKNLQYFLLTFLPEPAVHHFMWEMRPRMRSWIKNLRGRHVRV